MTYYSLKIGQIEFDLIRGKKGMQNMPRESGENNFIALLNFIVDPAVIVDEKAHILLVNNAFEDLTGLSKQEVIGKVFLEVSILPAESKKTMLENLKKRMQGLPVQPYEVTFANKTGETRYAEVKAKKVNYAGQSADLVIFRDITRRKRNLAKIKEYSEKMETLVDEKVREIKESAEKLQASEKHFRETLDNMMEGCQIIGYDWRYLYVNDAAAKHGHATKEQLLGKTMTETYPGIEKTAMFSELQRCMQNRVSACMENEFEYPDGEKGWFELRVQPTPEGIFVLSVDITERKQMEMKLREAEKRYRTLFDQAPLGILLIDNEARAVEFNAEAHRQLGYSREEFAKLTVSDYEVLETPEETRARMEKILKTGRDEFETKHRTKTGEIRDVRNTVQVVELAGKKFFQLITRDITEQKKIGNELKLEHSKLEAVTENVGAGLAIISKDYHILWANKLLKQIHGDWEGKMCYSTFNRLTGICPDCGVKKVFENGAQIDVHEYTNKDNKGNTFWVELIVTPIKDEKGNVTAALELAVNITEKKIMQNKLSEYSQKLEKLVEKRTEQLKQTQAKLLKAEKLAAIGELAGMVGHDLRNPLTGIMGATYYLKTKYAKEIDDTGKEMLETIDKAIEHSNKIINDLLEYSSKLCLDFAETTPKLLLKKTLVSIEVPERIQIIDATKNKPKIKVDIGNISKVFANIITNAIEAMPTAGTLTIRSKIAKDNVKIIFKDTGTGMTEETLSKLRLGFPLFTTKAKGMGFGLPICKRIVEAHGGKISLKSTLGKGTTVTVTIPVSPRPMETGEEKWIFNESVLQTIVADQEKHKR
jgi:two-component system cell cycle sensor histidine kinase/response regulator CckA